MKESRLLKSHTQTVNQMSFKPIKSFPRLKHTSFPYQKNCKILNKKCEYILNSKLFINVMKLIRAPLLSQNTTKLNTQNMDDVTSYLNKSRLESVAISESLSLTSAQKISQDITSV